MAPPFSSKPHIEPSLKRVRVLFGGQYIVDTKKAKLVWEHPYYPTYFFSSGDIKKEFLQPSVPDDTKEENQQSYDVVVGERVAKKAVTKYTDGAGDLSGLSKVTFGSMDAWFEEEEQIFVHPKDPYKRVDVLQSSRHVRIEVNGVEVANTHKPRLLFETGLPIRTYIPKTDCRLDLLEPSSLTTQCPYKGVASYYSVRLPKNGNLVEDIVWWYRSPLAECIDIKGYAAFYDEKVDVWVDGEKQERPKTPFP
ncbi:DUF427-domain-containing protein [Fomitiporia mediterranea MF3/22]|uniref:DUF427-domain-containing protein n=1 Tax=Fomitiporia mediterranea (strain MF3/22) TaxID=694068 RepID=UPI0004408445|nr:DUF427-domain-containing protein [Fomitiporia mediterranea MF3/22]EJD06922.1 DUF427-domain-containing protein [Fomitiporia mediterranea MF3/22]